MGWSRRDTAVVTATVALAALARLPGLGRPDRPSFDEAYYVPDALAFLGRGGEAVAWVHPELGRWLIAAGIAVAGDDPVGWRLTAAVAGLAAVALTAVLGRALLGTPGLVAGLLVAVDGMAVVQSRTAMLDSFLPALLVGAVLAALPWLREGPQRRPWWRLALCGALLGAAVAVKWAAAPLLGGLALLVLVRNRPAPGDRAGRARLASALVAVPAAVYLLSYARWWADNGIDPGGFVRLHRAMLDYHQTLTETHPYGSEAWTWLLLRRPVAYSFEAADGTVSHVLALGNPVLWWGFLALLPALAAAWWRGRDLTVDLVVLAVGCLYLPWLVTFRQGFAFYLTPLVPFMALGLTWAVTQLWERGGAGRVAAASVPAAAVAAAGWFLPLWTAMEISRSHWERLILFDGWI